MRDYALHAGIADDELVAADFFALIHQLDEEFLAVQAEQAEAQRRGKSKPPKVP